MKSCAIRANVAPMRSATPAMAGPAANSAAATSTAASRTLPLTRSPVGTSRGHRPVSHAHLVVAARILPGASRGHLRLVGPEHGTEALADLAERHRGVDGVDDQRDEVLRAAGPALERIERAPRGVAGAGGPQAAHALGQRVADTDIDLEQVGRWRILGDEVVDADDHTR